jgi:predicted nucleic acid-binding Zn ribbon protein
MPVYLYRNLTTNETFELEQRITAPALTHHPETGDPVKRLIQPVGIAFKGSGFYVTDSRSSNGAGKTASKADSGKEGGSPAKADKPSKPGEGKSAESKPRESKAESKSSAS